MNTIARQVCSTIFKVPSQGIKNYSLSQEHYQIQQWRGIRVRVFDGNLERALQIMQRKLRQSGIDRLIKNQATHHVKNSEKRVLARKNLQRKIQAKEFSRKLRSILIKKISGQ